MKPYDDIVIQPLASSITEKHYILSYKTRWYEISRPLAELIQELQQNSSKEEAIVAYIEKKNAKYTFEQVEEIINRFIIPIVQNQKTGRRESSFFYERELISSGIIERFSNKFQFLFHKTCMIPILLTTVCLDVFFFCHTENLLVFNNTINVYTLFGLLIFMLLSSLFHELGHASACKFFGLRHGGIGFGLYLNFPVLYTDVTEVWTLNRGKRMVVNIAGVYFQSIWLIVLLLVFFVTGYDTPRYLILMMNFGFLMTLNPFFKFDGYWMMSDLLGVPNLRSRSKELLLYFYNRIRKHPIGTVPYLLQIRPIERCGLLVYSVVVNLFMAFYFFYIIPVFLCRFISSFPNEVRDLILYLSNGLTPPFALLRNIGMQVIFIVLIAFFFYKLVQSVILYYGKLRTNTK